MAPKTQRGARAQGNARASSRRAIEDEDDIEEPSDLNSDSSPSDRDDGKSNSGDDDGEPEVELPRPNKRPPLAPSKWETACAKRREAIVEEHAETTKRLLKKYPVVKEEDLDRMLAVPLGPFFTDADKQQLEADWHSDPRRAKVEAFVKTTAQDLLAVWKLTTRFYHKIPYDIIGPHNYLEVTLERVSGKYQPLPDRCRDPCWASSFCKALINILLHPMWGGGDDRLLVLALQYSVLVRTRDRRAMSISRAFDSRFLKLLADEFDNNGQKDPAERAFPEELRKAAASRAREGGSVLPDVSDFLRNLEKLHKAKRTEKAARKSNLKKRDPTDDVPAGLLDGNVADKPYLAITTEDLEVIAKALDGPMSWGVPRTAGVAMDKLHIDIYPSKHGAPNAANLKGYLKKTVLKWLAEDMIETAETAQAPLADAGEEASFPEVLQQDPAPALEAAEVHGEDMANNLEAVGNDIGDGAGDEVVGTGCSII